MKGQLKVLHIAGWFPDRENPQKGVFIREHIEALAPFCTYTVRHVEVRSCRAWFRFRNYDLPGINGDAWIIETRLNRWKIIELVNFFLLITCLLKTGYRKYDLVNFHIAYPQLRFIKWIRRIIRKPMVITEHWSAYHYNFNLPEHTESLRPVKRIFHAGIPVITVSEALRNDIMRFSGLQQPGLFHIVPNSVDTGIFSFREKKPVPGSINFAMINGWGAIKKPFLVLEAFRELQKEYPGIRLRIGGTGPQFDAMDDYLNLYNLRGSVSLLGRLTKPEVAAELKQADYLLQPSGYETFSVICAEALCCGTPVIASAVGGIPGFINSGNGILVPENTVEYWIEIMRKVISGDCKFASGKQIAADAYSRFDKQQVGRLYREVLEDILLP